MSAIALVAAAASLNEVVQAPAAASSQHLSTRGGPVLQAATQALTNFLNSLVALTDRCVIAISPLLTLPPAA